MGQLEPLFKGKPIIISEAIDKIRVCDQETLLKLYFHTNDPIQMLLIEKIFELKGYAFPTVEDDTPKETA